MGHRILGIAALLFWLWVLLHVGLWFPKLLQAHDAAIVAVVRGAALVLVMPVLGAALLIVPDWFVERCSPYAKETGEPYLDRSFWLLLGYLILGLAWAFLQLFR